MKPHVTHFRSTLFMVLFGILLSGLEGNKTRGEESIPNPLLEQLMESGVDVGGAVQIALPPSTLPDGLALDAVRKQLEPIYQRHGWDRFTRNSQVAPFELKLGTIIDQQKRRVGHTVSVWFVAHGKFQLLTDRELLEQLAASVREERAENAAESESDAIEGNELSVEQLAAMGIQVQADSRNRETFLQATFSVLNRVQVAGVARVVSSRHPQSLVVAWELDPRFEQQGPHKNSWRSIERTPLGERRLGEAQTYRGYGGYGKITVLNDPEDALLVECHVVVHEPEEWFAGSNALRAKIPLGIQENVRKFRRELSRLQPPDTDN